MDLACRFRMTAPQDVRAVKPTFRDRSLVGLCIHHQICMMREENIIPGFINLTKVKDRFDTDELSMKYRRNQASACAKISSANKLHDSTNLFSSSLRSMVIWRMHVSVFRI